MDESSDLYRPVGDPHPNLLRFDAGGETAEHAAEHVAGRQPPALLAESFRLALAQERETVRKTYLEIAELRRRVDEAEARADRVKKTLTFALGAALVQTRKPWDYLTLGFRLRRALVLHRKVKAQPQRVAPAAPVSVARRAAALQQALGLARARDPAQAAHWTHTNVRNASDRAHILVEIGMAALPGDPAAAAELARAAERLAPDSVRVKALLLSIEAVEAGRGA